MLPSWHVLCISYNHALCHAIQSHIRKVHTCFAVTCHLHFQQNDLDLLHATAVAQRWNGYQNKSRHRKLTMEKKIHPLFLQGFKPATFQSQVQHSNHWAIPAPWIYSLLPEQYWCSLQGQLASHWTLTSCQPHSHLRMFKLSRKQTHFQNSFYTCKPFLKPIPTQIWNETYMITQTSNTNFQRVHPFNISLVKKAYKARTCWYHCPFCLLYWYQIKEEETKELTENSFIFVM